MRGHQPLLEMRRRGAMPHAATLCLDPVPWDLAAHWPEDGNHVCAQIAVGPDESIARLDLRMLVGLPIVFVDGSDRARVEALFAACIAVKPQRVVAGVIDYGGREPHCIEIIDSERILTWRA